MKADRLISLLLLLQSAQRRTARELAARLEVSERTIYRDIDALGASGIPVYTERGSEGGIALADGYRRALTHFGDDEIRALFASGSAVLADLGLGVGFDLALEKLRGAFSDTQRRAAEQARNRIHVDQRRWNQSDAPVEKLVLLRRAVWDDRRISLTYEDRHRTRSTRPVDPFGLVSKAGVWYLIARTAEGFRSFRVDRVAEVQELHERFERPADFDLNEHWSRMSATLTVSQQRQYPVTLRVDADAIAMVSGYWPAESVDPNDPSVLRVFFLNERVALHEVLAWSESVELLDPPELALAIVARAQALIQRYDRSANR